MHSLRRSPVPRPFRGRSPRGAALLLVLVSVLVACAGLVREPEVEVVGVDLLTLGVTGGSVRLVLGVENPNRYELRVRRHDYHLEVERGADEWTTLARGTDSTEVVLPARGELRVPVEVPFRYRDVGAAVVAAVREGQLTYRLSGEVRVRAPLGGVDVPYRTGGILEP